MVVSHEPRNEAKSATWLGVGAFLAWTLLMVVALAWHDRHNQEETLERAVYEARTNLNKDMAFRYWATAHGGVYVPVTEQTQPIDLLEGIPERDIATPSGKRLTLVDPASMVRQVMTRFEGLYGIRGRITSLNPLNPANTPDDWERLALQALARGTPEVTGLAQIDGLVHFRLMAPMRVEDGCLKCHEGQDYELGVASGGVGVAVPLARQPETLLRHLSREGRIFFAIWLVGVGGIGAVTARSRGRARERAQTMAAVLAGEERFRLLFAGAPLAYQSLDGDGRCIEVNEAWLEMMGYDDARQIEGQAFLDFVAPNFRPAAAASMARFMREGTAGGTELELLRRDGSLCPVVVEGRIGRDVRGRFLQTHCILIDMTENRRAEAAIHKFSQAIEHSPVVVVMTDTSGTIEYVNQRFVEVSGYSREEALGRNPRFLKSGRADGADYRELWSTLKSGRTWQGVFCNRHKNGTLYWEEALVAPVSGADGQTVHYIAFKTDITERRRTEERLEQSEARLAEAQRIARLGNWSWDVAGGDLFWSEETYRIFGHCPGEFVPSYEGFCAMVHPDDRARVKESESLAFGKGIPHAIDHRIVLPDGRIRWVHQEAIAVRGADGRADRLSGTVQDITERKEGEETLRRAVQELTRANIQLERFAYVAAHDLQEPLRNLVSYSQLLDKRHGASLEGDGRDFLALIIGAATRMRILVSDLLTYSRLDTRSQTFRRVDLIDAVTLAETNLKDAIAETNAQIVVAPMPQIRGDEMQVVLVFQHLISNAIKYRREGIVPRVQIEARLEGNEWVFSVKDNGIGIEPQYFDKIFEVFKRLHSTAEYPGTGIGLAICRRVVERHGGRIWVDSTPGQGSTFSFALPIRNG
ncbi:MAG: PAS domain S-box protein [Magnetospirillum sp. WYHS-4]